ncbi:MAG: P1 family peptidase [Ilumatobacteraceae bacterium]
MTGLAVGHHQRSDDGWLTGTTVVLCGEGATAGVDVRGGAPGTRETDLLRPENLVQQVHAICLTGGGAFGLAAADGVMQWLARLGDEGFGSGSGPRDVVPIVRRGDLRPRP